MVRGAKPLLLLLTYFDLTNGWVTTNKASRSPFPLFSLAQDDETSRRSFILSSLGWTSGNFAFTAAAIADGEDPFSKMDSIAAKIGSDNSGYPNSISPLPTFKQSEKELVQNEEKSKIQTSSEMEEALKNVRKEKRIDPRTHG